jgi:hypothetical protein
MAWIYWRATMPVSDRKYDQLTPSNILRSVIEDVTCRNAIGEDADPSHYPTHYPTFYPTHFSPYKA